MSLWTKLINKLSLKKTSSEESLNMLNGLPELESEPLTLASQFNLMANGGAVCNIANWKQVEKDILLTVEVPVGFKRDINEPLEIFVSMDKSMLYVRDVTEDKLADVYIEDENGQLQIMQCTVGVLKKLMQGDIRFNVIAKGFEAVEFLDATPIGEVEVLSQTAFTHTQDLLIDETVGYMCMACKEMSEQELVVIINIGNPFIMLPDGTKVEGEVSGANTDIVLNQLPDSAAFDSLLDGTVTQTVNMPCHVTLKVEVEIFS